MTSHPNADSPEKRYVCLHRAIEQGCASDEIWEELADVCHRLGYVNEAVRCAREIIVDAERHRVELRLAQQGVAVDSVGLAEKTEEDHGPDPDEPSNWKRGASLRESHIREEITDAAAYLFLDHIPFTLMTVTLIFPLVVGVGGTLSAGTDFWVFPAIALSPVLCIAVVIGAMLRRIVVDSARGFTDAPRISDLPQQSPGALRFIRDCFVAGIALLVPGVLACQYLGTIGLPALVVCAALFPLAVALCQTRGDMSGVHPKVLLPAAYTIGIPGAIAVATAWLSFTPAMSALWLTEGSALFMRMSIVGPLAIVPLFMSARLLGRTLFLNRDKMEDVIWTTTPKLCSDDANIEIYDSQIVESQRISRVEAPTQADPAQCGQPKIEPQRKRHVPTGRSTKPVHPERAREPRPTRHHSAAAAPTRAPAPSPSPAQTRRKQPAPVSVDDIPGLEGLGFRVLVGDERVAAGASPLGIHG